MDVSGSIMSVGMVRQQGLSIDGTLREAEEEGGKKEKLNRHCPAATGWGLHHKGRAIPCHSPSELAFTFTIALLVLKPTPPQRKSQS
jgi:hypothetical protein